MPVPKKITAWSASRLAVWEKCPRQAKFKYIDKLDEGPKGENLEYGIEVHKGAEDYIAGRTNTLHEGLKKVKAIVEKLRASYKKKLVRVEMEAAFTKDWKPTHWFGKDVYLRVKMDVLKLPEKSGGDAEVIDWKTGRFKDKRRVDEDDDALNLYAVGALSLGLAKSVTSKLIYTQVGKPVTRPKGSVSLTVLKQFQKEWDNRAAPMLADKVFPTRPGAYCSFCPYTANKGGPCEY